MAETKPEKRPATNLRNAVHQYANQNLKRKVGKGTCWDLAEHALIHARAKTSHDYGRVTPTSDYIWGAPVNLAAALPGNILQFKNHSFSKETKKKYTFRLPDQSTIEYETTHVRTFRRGHHTAIAHSVSPDGKITVLEQHVRRGGQKVEETVDYGVIYTRNSMTKPTRSKENITINAQWAERIKANLKSPADKKRIDQILQSYKGKTFVANLESSAKISVKGSIRAYTPQSK